MPCDELPSAPKWAWRETVKRFDPVLAAVLAVAAAVVSLATGDGFVRAFLEAVGVLAFGFGVMLALYLLRAGPQLKGDRARVLAEWRARYELSYDASGGSVRLLAAAVAVSDFYGVICRVRDPDGRHATAKSPTRANQVMGDVIYPLWEWHFPGWFDMNPPFPDGTHVATLLLEGHPEQIGELQVEHVDGHFI